MAASDRLRRAIALLGFALLLVGAARGGQPFTVFCYHDVEDEPSRTAADTITTRRLVEHFEWLKADGWTVVSVADILAARAGGPPLPAKAAVLTFDDGYASFATRVLPLLEAYRYPAVFAFVTSWLEVPADGEVDYGGTPAPRSRFVSVEQLRHIAASPWVEVASHSHALHRALRANREGNEMPAAITRVYDPATAIREDAALAAARVRADLERSSAALQELTGRKPRVLAWPFGRFNQDGIDAARAAGFEVLLALHPGPADTDHLDAIPRYYPDRNPTAADLERMIRPPFQPGIHRAAVVDPTTISGAATDEARDAALGWLIDAARQLGIRSLHLEAFSDRDGDGRPDTAYFPGSHFVTGPDHLGRLAWQARTRAGVEIVVRLPLATTDEADWRALGESVPFDAVMFTDYVSGRDDPARLTAALAVLRRYQPTAQLHLRVPPEPGAAGNWAALQPLLLWPERTAGAGEPAGWLREPAARGRVAVEVGPDEAVATDWLGHGILHLCLSGPPPVAPSPALRRALSAAGDPFAAP